MPFIIQNFGDNSGNSAGESWTDVAAEWQQSSDYAADASCTSAAVKSFLWTLPVGRYTLRLTDGTVYLQTIRSDAQDATTYRWYFVYSDNGQTAMTYLYRNDLEIWASGLSAGGVAIRIGNNGIMTRREINTALGQRTTPEQARTIANEQILSQVTQPFNDAVVGVRLRKYTEVIETDTRGTFLPGRKCLRLDIQNADWIKNKWNSIHSCRIHLMINARKRGCGYHWWHPKNWDFIPDEGEIKGNKAGYGVIAGQATNRDTESEETFPAVPSWMPNNGYMQTEIPVTLADLQKGYVLIYPEKYFLPMLKPVVIDAISIPEKWGRNIAVIGTECRNPHPLLCGWVLAIDGVELGLPQQAYRFGCSRHKYIYNQTNVSITNGAASIVNYYSSISTK